MLKLNRLFLFLILVIAIVLRFWSLSSNPPSLNWDEVSHGYNAYSILKTGKDEWGVSFPTIFRAYGDYKLPVYIYLTAISEFFFGLTPFAVRFVSAFAGVGTVYFTYLLVKKLFDDRTALFSSFLVAIEPWSLFLSRGAFEASLSLFFIVSGSYFFLRGLKQVKYLVLSSILLGFSLWTYNSARVFVPLFIALLLVLYKSDLVKIKRSMLLVASGIFLVFLIPMVAQLGMSQGQARYENVSILDQGAIATIENARAKSVLPSALNRLVNNRYMFFIETAGKNYLSHFSPDFLLISGGSNYQFNVQNLGLLYPIDAIFILLGIYLVVKTRTKEGLLILGWFLLAPIPASVTRESPHTLRAITMLPIPMILSALGIGFVGELIKKQLIIRKLLVFGFIGVMCTFLVNYLNVYFGDYRTQYSSAWQYGYGEAVDYVKTHYNDYDQIIFTKKYGEPHEFILFDSSWDPKKYQNDPNLFRFYQSNWYWVDRFDKFYFVNDWEIPENGSGIWRMEKGGEFTPGKRTLIVTSPEKLPIGWSYLKEIDFLNGDQAFVVGEKQ